MFLNLFLFYQVVRPLGRKSVNKYLYLYLYLYTDGPTTEKARRAVVFSRLRGITTRSKRKNRHDRKQYHIRFEGIVGGR